MGTFDYVIARVAIVSPHDTSVLDQTKEPSLLLLTTRSPRLSAFQRLVVFAERV